MKKLIASLVLLIPTLLSADIPELKNSYRFVPAWSYIENEEFDKALPFLQYKLGEPADEILYKELIKLYMFEKIGDRQSIEYYQKKISCIVHIYYLDK